MSGVVDGIDTMGRLQRFLTLSHSSSVKPLRSPNLANLVQPCKNGNFSIAVIDRLMAVMTYSIGNHDIEAAQQFNGLLDDVLTICSDAHVLRHSSALEDGHVATAAPAYVDCRLCDSRLGS